MARVLVYLNARVAYVAGFQAAGRRLARCGDRASDAPDDLERVQGLVLHGWGR